MGCRRSGSIRILPRPLAALGLGSMLMLLLAGSMRPQPVDLAAWEYGSSPNSLPATTENPWNFWRLKDGSLDLSYPELVGVLKLRMPRRTRPRVIEALSAQILRLCRELGFQPSFVLAVIEHESGFRPRALSPKNAVGLMQLRHGTAAEVALKIGYRPRGAWLELRDPVVNVTLGMHYLAELRSQFETLEGTLAAYNLGPARWAELLKTPSKLQPDGPTARYVGLIQQTSRQLKVDARITWRPKLAARKRRSSVL